MPHHTSDCSSPCRPNTAYLLLLLGVGGAHLWWLLADQSVWPWDQAWYAEESLTLFVNRVYGTYSAWLLSMQASFGVKAPAIAWIGQFFVPLRHLTGSIESALLLLNVCSGLLAAALVHSTCRALWPSSRPAAMAATLFFLAAPQCVGLIHQYCVEPLQLLVVALVLYMAVMPPSLLSTVAMPGVAALGLLAKVTVPGYVFAPGLVWLIRLFRVTWTPFRRTAMGWAALAVLGCASCISIAGCIAWYVHNGEQIQAFVKLATASDAAAVYGSYNPFWVKLKFWLLHSSLAFSISPLVATALVLCFAIAVGLELRRRRGVSPTEAQLVSRTASPWTMVLVSILQVVTILCIFSAQVNEETRYLLPILPYLAVLIGFTVQGLGGIRVGQIAIAAFALQLWFTLGVSLGIPTVLQRSPWLIAVHSDQAHRQTLNAVVKDTCTQQGRYNIIAQELPFFNANSASFFVLKKQVEFPGSPRCYYTSLGYAEKDSDKAWTRLVEMKTAHVVLRKDAEIAADNPFNAVNGEIERRLQQSDLYDPMPASDPVLEVFQEVSPTR